MWEWFKKLAVIVPLTVTVGGLAYTGACMFVRHVNAGDGLVKQKAIDKYEDLFRALQEEQGKAAFERGLMQNDLGTIKQFQKEQKEDFKEYTRENNKALRDILSGVRSLSNP